MGYSRLAFIVALGLLVFAFGCGSRERAKTRAEQMSHVRILATYFGRFSAQRRRSANSNADAAFREYIRGLSAEDRFGKEADALFSSERDGKPLVILYDGGQGPPGPAGAPVCIYEQQGLNGKRYVASNMGAVEEVDEARFQQLVPNAAAAKTN